MAASRTFHGIEQATWRRMKAVSRQEHGTVHADGIRGSAVTQTPVGSILIDFEFDAEQQTIIYTIVRKPVLISESQIWDGVEKTVARCKADRM